MYWSWLGLGYKNERKTNGSQCKIPFKDRKTNMCVCVCHTSQPVALLSSAAPFWLCSGKASLAVAAGRSPGDRPVETIPTKWRELMWLINTLLIICKLHVWVHIIWETYAACQVPPNERQLICLSGVPWDWRQASQRRKTQTHQRREKV